MPALLPPPELLAKAVSLHQAGNLSEAETLYHSMRLSYPKNPDILTLSGILQMQRHAVEKAIALFDEAITANPQYAGAYHERGNALAHLHHHQDALHSYDQAVALNPGNADSWHNRALTLHYLGRHEDALQSCDHALALNAAHADAHNTRAVILQALKRHGDALQSSNQAIALQPHSATAYNNRGLALHALKQYDEALQSYDKALSLDPAFAMACNNRGLTLHALNRSEEALASFDNAIALNPRLVMAHNNRGLLLRGMRRYQEAIASFDRAIALAPDDSEAYWQKSWVKLLLGEYEEGWKLYEWRWKQSGMEASPSRKPLWLGKEKLAGKTILLHAEQGFGDTIMFCRYISMVEALGAKVLLGIPSPLASLISTLKGSYTLLEQGTHTQPHDFHCPLLSLPLAFGTMLQTLPSSVPYLFPDAEKQHAWRQRLGEKTRPRVGIVWSGNAKNTWGLNRSMALQDIMPLLDPRFEFHCLQKEIRPEDEASLATSGIMAHTQELRDFSDTAALMAEMDRVISIDTGVAHLAGALGKPVWVMLHYIADFRWLADRSDSPWYPTARLFRQQQPDDWGSVIMQLKEALADVR